MTEKYTTGRTTRHEVRLTTRRVITVLNPDEAVLLGLQLIEEAATLVPSLRLYAKSQLEPDGRFGRRS